MRDDRDINAELLRRNAVLAAISYAAARIVSVADWRSAIPEFLERLGNATNVSRTFLCETHTDPASRGQAKSCRFMWTAPGIAIIPEECLLNVPIPHDAPLSPIADIQSKRNRGDVVQITLNEAKGDVRHLLEEFGTLSVLSVPIIVEGNYWGYLGFDDCQEERVWDEVEVDLLRTATKLIAAGMERSRADERLREQDNLLKAAQRIAQLGSWVLDFETNTVSWSEEGLRIFGLDTASPVWSLEENLHRVHPEDRSLVAEMDAQARNHGQAFEIEYRVTRSDGEVRILRERTDVIRDSLGKPSRLVGVVHDITEIRLSELRLKESDERYALAARGAGAGLWDWNFSSGRSYFSPRMHELLAVPQGSLDQSIGEFFKCFLPEDRKKLESQLEELYATQSERLELEVRSNVTDFRWFQIRGLVVYENSRPARLVGSLIDITDRKRAFEEIARQREALYQNEKMAMLGSLLAGVSHELNNPLSVVIGQAALLEETVSDPSVLKRVARIQNATERCARIVRTFLAMARQRDLQFAPVHINSVVDTVLELLAFQLRSSQIQVERDLAFGDPLLMGDADQLHQLLTNLVVNARQALASVTSPRFIRISTRLISQRRLQILVSDNGPGIPAEIRPRIFDPFFSTKPAGEGTGIGLSLCSSIIRAHGGSITVDNNAKGGATNGQTYFQ